MEQKHKGIKILPQHVQHEVNAFIDSIKNINFLKPDSAPKKEWKLFYGENWSKALDAASNDIKKETILEVALIMKRQDGESSPKSGIIHTPNTSRVNSDNAVAHVLLEAGLSNAAGKLAAKAIKDTLAQVSKALKREGIELPEEVATYASLDFALNAAYLLAGEKIQKDDANRKNAEAFLEVWKKGYALFCDYKGILYVYVPTPKRGGEEVAEVKR